ncbi:hypothetical protein NPIL_64261 [Nephila pilipes]|uniref:Uncharacterized protein n=1 Tax=Nephila pilipes TaxID=299642 RepID=A0A8X6QJ26_NEPPI|nr:hypothetical protein NPIL_64261 [Nephila pilipes]
MFCAYIKGLAKRQYAYGKRSAYCTNTAAYFFYSKWWFRYMACSESGGMCFGISKWHLAGYACAYQPAYLPMFCTASKMLRCKMSNKTEPYVLQL